MDKTRAQQDAIKRAMNKPHLRKEKALNKSIRRKAEKTMVNDEGDHEYRF